MHIVRPADNGGLSNVAIWKATNCLSDEIHVKLLRLHAVEYIFCKFILLSI